MAEVFCQRGLRIYKIYVTRKGHQKPVDLRSDKLKKPVPKFIEKFIERHGQPQDDKERERSWYFEDSGESTELDRMGHIHYGTFGYESSIVDAGTRAEMYNRKRSDIEEIPLFYEFWFPDDERFFLAAFQSFQGKSCIQMVTHKMKQLFEHQNQEFFLRISKITPTDVSNSTYFSAPVKEVTLIRRRASSDIADGLIPSEGPEMVNLKLTVSALRNSSLGPLDRIMSMMPKKAGKAIISLEGTDFSEAVAKIKVGKSVRRVGLQGFDSDAGVIDISDAIELGDNGHPIFESIRDEAGDILADIYESVQGFGT